jgi:hypothetical protein
MGKFQGCEDLTTGPQTELQKLRNARLLDLPPRKCDHNLSAFASAVAQRDGAGVSFDDAFGDGSAQACSLALRCKEWLKDSLPVFRAQSGTVIPHGNSQCLRAIQSRQGAGDFDLDRVLAGGEGVFEQISKDAFQSKQVHAAV